MTEYTTKDSGERQQWESGMMRDVQTGKPRFALVVTSAQPYEDQMLTRYARLLARGAEKYADRNWEQGSGNAELEYAKESLLRHTMQLITGETDEDHAAAVWFNVQVIEYIRWRQDQGAKFSKAVADSPIQGAPNVALAPGDSYEEAQAYARGRADQAADDEYGRLWLDEYDREVSAEMQAEIERQFSPAAKRNETPFSQAVQRYSDNVGFVRDVGSSARELMRAAQQLGLDRDQR